MDLLYRLIRRFLGEAPVRFTRNPRIVSLFGERVTPARAWICGVAFLLNSHLLFVRDFPAFEIKTPAQFLAHAAGYFFFYLGFIGFTSVLTLWLAAYFLTIFIEATLNANPDKPLNLSQNQEETFQVWCISALMFFGEAYLVLGYFLGYIWSDEAHPLIPSFSVLVGIFINMATYLLDKFGHVWHLRAILRRGVARAKEEPVSHRVVCW